MTELPSEKQIRNAKIRELDQVLGSEAFDLENNTAQIPFTEWEIEFIGHCKDLIDRYKKDLSENEKRKVDEIWTKHESEFELEYEVDETEA